MTHHTRDIIFMTDRPVSQEAESLRKHLRTTHDFLGTGINPSNPSPQRLILAPKFQYCMGLLSHFPAQFVMSTIGLEILLIFLCFQLFHSLIHSLDEVTDIEKFTL